jgi:hypothetical protein
VFLGNRCTAGYYALRRPEDLAQYPHGNVYGVVKLWGKVIPAERGFRAEYAYPVAMVVSIPYHGLHRAEALVDAYKLPVHIVDASDMATPRQAMIDCIRKYDSELRGV